MELYHILQNYLHRICSMTQTGYNITVKKNGMMIVQKIEQRKRRI